MTIQLIDVTPMKTKAEARTLFTEGNNKLDKSIAIFNLPASQEVCGRICKGCYAIKAQVLYPTVMPSRTKKLEASKSTSFVARTVGALRKLASPRVRIHESGDFYSQEYVNKWVEVAQAMPDITFVAYTKRMSDFDFKTMRSLPNTIIINSLFGKKLNYGPLSKAPKTATLCPASKCGSECNICYDLSNKTKLETDGIFFKAH